MKRIKPKLRTINPNTIKHSDIEYLCKTSIIDEMVMKKKGLEFDAALADEMESETRHYFIVKKSGEYDVLSGEKIEPKLKEWDYVQQPQTEKALTSIKHFIKRAHGV